MILAPYRVCRDMDDDHAPVDYSYVSSSSEAALKRQQQNIKRPGAAGVAARHRVEPEQKADAYGIRARELPSDSGVRDTVMRKLPSLADGAPTPASVAYPDDLGIPDNPFAPPPETRKRASVGTRVVESGTRAERGGARAVMPGGNGAGSANEREGVQSADEYAAQASIYRTAQAADAYAAPSDQASRAISGALYPVAPMPPARPSPVQNLDGSQFDPPLSPDMPEWLRIARQNPLPEDNKRARAPRVASAPPVAPDMPAQTDALGRPLRSVVARQAPRRQPGTLPSNARDYAEAGYPEPLLNQQAALENEVEELSRRRRHGAQYAVNPYRQEEYERALGVSQAQSSYPPARQAPAARQQSAAYAPQPPLDDTRASGYMPTQPLGDTRTAAYEAATADSAYARRSARRVVSQQAEAEASPYQVVTDERWSDEETDNMPAYVERAPIPWLSISMLVAAVLAVALWLMQLTFEKQTEQVIEAREEVSRTILERHPYHYRELIEKYALKYNINPAFVAAIVLNESSFNPTAVSSVGARGLMQLMDDTASWIYDKMALSSGYSFDSLFGEDTNLDYGCWYLGFLCERFRGDPVLVSAAFHAGQNTVQNWLNDSRYSADSLTIKLDDMMDGPTKQYATRVTRDYAIYMGLYYTEDDA